jgi:hypothetical protein
VEDLLAERGIEVSFQTVAEWAAKFGKDMPVPSGGGQGKFADKRYLDEMVVTMTLSLSCAGNGSHLMSCRNLELSGKAAMNSHIKSQVSN